MCMENLFLLQVNTETCEQTFSWLSRYSCHQTQEYNQLHFFLFCTLSDLHNLREVKKTT